jgi:C-terminal processing protease CtpA/Prc
VIDSLAHQLQRFYVRPGLADSLARGLEQRRQGGAFDGARTQAALATQLDRAIRAMVHDDAHLKVRYDPPRSAPGPTAAPLDPAAEQRRRRDEFIRDAHEESFGIPEVRTLEGNVGYVRVGEFLYQLSMGNQPFSKPAIIAAMQFVAERDALILDLRANRGGHTSVPGFMLAYLFDGPTLLASTRFRDGSTSQGKTVADVPPPAFGGTKPLFVLTGDSTFSAGEAIAAALKSHRRARIVGARTRGGANSGDFHSIGAGLEAFIPDAQNFDATGGSTETIGVAPDVAVPASRAFDVAYALALDTLAKSDGDPAHRAKLDSLARVAKSRAAVGRSG